MFRAKALLAGHFPTKGLRWKRLISAFIVSGWEISCGLFALFHYLHALATLVQKSFCSSVVVLISIILNVNYRFSAGGLPCSQHLPLSALAQTCICFVIIEIQTYKTHFHLQRPIVPLYRQRYPHLTTTPAPPVPPHHYNFPSSLQ